MLICKNEEFKPDNQRTRSKAGKFQGDGRIRSHEKERIAGRKNRPAPDKALQRKTVVPYDLGTIPAINIRASLKSPDDLGYDMMFIRNGIELMTFLKVAEKILPYAMFDDPKDINQFGMDVLDRINDVPGLHIAKIRKDGISIVRTGYQFKGYYVFDMNWFYDEIPLNIRKVIFPVIDSILDHLGTDLNDLAMGYFESDLDDQKSNEDEGYLDVEQIENMTEAFDDATRKFLEYDRITTHYKLDIVNDIEWICEFLFYNGHEKWNPSLLIISDIIKNIGLNSREINFSEDESYGGTDIQSFTFLREEFQDYYLGDTMDSYFGETGTNDVELFDVTLVSETLPQSFNTVNACMIDRIFKEINFIIYDTKI